MSSLDFLKPFTVEKPQPLIGAKTVQILLMREILDYTVLRTEDTRELNTVATPLSLNNGDDTIRRVAFLATKQKAAESRQLEQLLRTGTSEAGMSGNRMLSERQALPRMSSLYLIWRDQYRIWTCKSSQHKAPNRVFNSVFLAPIRGY